MTRFILCNDICCLKFRAYAITIDISTFTLKNIILLKLETANAIIQDVLQYNKNKKLT